jgi:vanillate O-demethylase ferredoxin subunit
MSEHLIDVTVVEKTVLAEGIAGIELVATMGNALPSFSAGSHVDVYLGEGLLRQYSLWNDPSESHRYCLGVLCDDEGRGGSKAVHMLNVGDALKISAPRNNFELDGGAAKSVLLAGGIGITPILSMSQALHQQGADFTMHYCARNSERMAFQDLIAASDFADKVQLHFDSGAGEQKFNMDALSKSPDAGTHLYVCGPTGFMDAVLASAKDAWPAATLHREYFSVDANVVEGEDRAFQIQISSSGDVLDVPADKSIVEILADIGIEIPTSCEQGICGTCITPVLQGTPDHRDLVLTDEEHDDNDQMTLCCSRALTELLVLDL